MKLLDLVFALIKNNVPMPTKDWADMRKEALEDADTWTGDDKNWFKRWYATSQHKWTMRLINSVSYIFLMKGIADFMSLNSEVDEEDE